MRTVVDFTAGEAVPPAAAVLASQGMPEGAALPERIGAILDSAMLLLAELARPRGLIADLPLEEFEEIYRGEGLNAAETPLDQIIAAADGLALFAATLGEAVSARISRLFAENDLALGYMLDAAASVAADRLADLLGERFNRLLARNGCRVLPYSPGYCGWHISGQGRLFARLNPEEIGMRLNESYLMQPLKSVSGVLVAGPGRIHKFRPRFSFCEDCRTRTCIERMASVLRART